MIKVRNQQLINTLGHRVKFLRQSKRLSMEKLAELAGIDYRQISYIEHGQTNATISTIYAISIALNISLPELLDFDPLG